MQEDTKDFEEFKKIMEAAIRNTFTEIGVEGTKTFFEGFKYTNKEESCN